jgi:hypothetical protein
MNALLIKRLANSIGASELPGCHNFEINIHTLYFSGKPLYVDYIMQISIQAVAILSPISGTEEYRILSLHII